MNVAYMLRPGDDNPELAYSLRSLVNLPSVESVWVVGSKPTWLRGVEFVHGNHKGDKPRNVFDNVLRLCEHADAPDDLLWLNDDFYLLAPYEHRVEYRAMLADHIRELKVGVRYSWWGASLRATLNWYLEQDLNPISYELHKPFLVNREQMATALREVEHVNPSNPPQWRTVYGNRWQIGGKQATDCKIYSGSSDDRFYGLPLLSTEDDSFALAEQFLADYFPTKSRYEMRRAA